jgi:hypothetical protein
MQRSAKKQNPARLTPAREAQLDALGVSSARDLQGGRRTLFVLC